MLARFTRFRRIFSASLFVSIVVSLSTLTLFVFVGDPNYNEIPRADVVRYYTDIAHFYAEKVSGRFHRIKPRD